MPFPINLVPWIMNLSENVIAWGILSGSFKRFRGTLDDPYKQG